MKLKTIKDTNVDGKKVLLRVDFNVPMTDGKVTDDTRITAALPTIEYLLKNNAKIILMSHLGRPGGKKVEELKLDAVATELSKILKKEITKLDDCIGEEVKSKTNSIKEGEIILLENTRFYNEEKDCNDEFCQKLAQLGDIFVIDSFGTAHRKHASTYGISKHLPTYAGFLIEKEVNALSKLIEKTNAPFTVIMGGAKIETKIGLMKNFISKADNFIVGGGLANTFLAAKGFNVADSLYEKDKTDLAQTIMLESQAMHTEFHLPFDAIVADEISDNAKTLDLPVRDVIGDMKILDIGEKTIENFEKIINESKTIIWNGPVGLFEKEPFSKGTKRVAQAIANAKDAQTIIGGGDTIDAIKHFGIDLNSFTHVSTGGGAMLQFLEGTMLPGIEIVLDN